MEGNTEGRGVSRAARERAVEYNTERADMEKGLSDRYIAVQRQLKELETNKLDKS